MNSSRSLSPALGLPASVHPLRSGASRTRAAVGALAAAFLLVGCGAGVESLEEQGVTTSELSAPLQGRPTRTLLSDTFESGAPGPWTEIIGGMTVESTVAHGG